MSQAICATCGHSADDHIPEAAICVGDETCPCQICDPIWDYIIQGWPDSTGMRNGL